MHALQPFVWRSRIRFVDTDASRRIHYTAMLRHFEAAEHEYLEAIGCPYPEMSGREVDYPRVHVEVDFQESLFYNDYVDIGVQIERVGGSSFTVGFEARKDGRLCATGKIVVVAIDRKTRKSCALPAALAGALKNQLRNGNPT